MYSIPTVTLTWPRLMLIIVRSDMLLVHAFIFFESHFIYFIYTLILTSCYLWKLPYFFLFLAMNSNVFRKFISLYGYGLVLEGTTQNVCKYNVIDTTKYKLI